MFDIICLTCLFNIDGIEAWGIISHMCMCHVTYVSEWGHHVRKSHVTGVHRPGDGGTISIYSSLFTCDVTHSHMWHGDVTHSHMWHGDVTQSHMWHGFFSDCALHMSVCIRGLYTWSVHVVCVRGLYTCVPWLIHVRDVTSARIDMYMPHSPRRIIYADHVTHSCVQALTGRDVKLSCPVTCDWVVSPVRMSYVWSYVARSCHLYEWVMGRIRMTLVTHTQMCCSVLQCVAVYYNVLQCVTMCCSVLQCVASSRISACVSRTSFIISACEAYDVY